MKNRFQKILSYIIVLTFIFSTAANAVTFPDIKDHWAKEYIEKVAAKGLVTGFDNGTFRPDANITVLQSLVMLSRLYDIDDDIKDQIIDKYKETLEDMPNTEGQEWSFEYLSVVLELGIVSEDGMKNMFSQKSIFKDASKEEIAVLLTKAMFLGDEAQNLKVYTLPFSDVDKISSAAKPYIYVMYDKGILTGDKDKKIDPRAEITRAVMATMLDRSCDYIEENDVEPEFSDLKSATELKGLITEVSLGNAESYIYVKDNNEKVSIVRINSDTKVYLDGKSSEASKLKKDMPVACKIDDERIALSIKADKSTDIVRGMIYYVAYTQPASITILDDDDDKVKYDVNKDADVYLNGEETTLKKLEKDDKVTLMIKDDKIYQANSISKIRDYDGVISSINYSSLPIKIDVKINEDQTMTFEYSSDIVITRNDEESSFDQLSAGDEVTITTEYDKLKKINTKAKEADLSGTIREILISAEQNKIKVDDSHGKSAQYNVSRNVKIIIGNKNATIYDLRLGYYVDINISGDEIVTLETSEIQSANNFSGRVMLVDKDNKLLGVQTNEAGQTQFIYLKVTNNTKIFDTEGSTKYLRDIEEGSNVICTAISENGEYVAVSILLP